LRRARSLSICKARLSQPDAGTKIARNCDILRVFELTLPSRFSRSSALVLTLAFIAVAFCASTAFSAERRCGIDREVTADFDGDGILDFATLRDDRIALSLSEQRTTVHLRALSDTIGLAATDIDRDGDTDLVSLGARGSIRGWNNQGSGSFAQWTIGPPSRLPWPTWAGTAAWSLTAPVVPSVLSGRSSSDAWLALPVASLTRRGPAIDIGLDSDRAPGDLGFADHSPRAPPQTFTS